jgi:hypothetical protein
MYVTIQLYHAFGIFVQQLYFGLSTERVGCCVGLDRGYI